MNLSLMSIEEATGLVYDSAHEDANIIFGAVIDPDLDDEVRVTVIATGFEEKKEKVKVPEMKRWQPKTTQQPMKATTRMLSKSLVDEKEHESIVADVMNTDDTYDTPTFLRKMGESQL